MRIRWFALMGACVLVGCGKKADPPMPALVPVTGVATRDGKPMAGAFVQFQADGNSDVTVTGVCGDDGRFEMKSLHFQGKEPKPGVPEGTYTVTVTPAMDENQRVGGLPVTLPTPVTVTAGRANDLTLEVGKKK